MTDKETLSDKRKVFHNECLNQATTNDERCLVNTIFGFIENQDQGFISDVENKIKTIESPFDVYKFLEWFNQRAGKELTNHSPQIAREQKALKHRPREAPAEMALSEDTNDICECGHEEGQHIDKGKCKAYIFNNKPDCSCKKFKPKKEGCGKKINFPFIKKKYKNDKSCGKKVKDGFFCGEYKYFCKECSGDGE